MRILRLDLHLGSRVVDVHPFLTVIGPLGADDRAELLAAIRSVAHGSGEGVRGLVQHQGLLVELDGGSAGAAGSTPAPPVVIDHCADPWCDTADLEACITDQERRVDIVGARMEEVRADLDFTVPARIRDLTARLPSAGGLDGIHRASERRIRDALRRLDTAPPTRIEQPAEVTALRRRLADHVARVRTVAAHLTGLESAVIKAEGDLEVARRSLAELQVSVTPTRLSDDEEARLEHLLFAAMDGGRLARWFRDATDDRSEVRSEARALLAKAGVDSWTAYTVARSHPGLAPEAAETLARAEQEVADAERRLASVREELDRDELATAMRNEIDAITIASRRFIGPEIPPDLDRALAGIGIEVPDQRWVEARDDLVDALAEAMPAVEGGEPTAEVDAAVVVERAQAWLSAQEAGGGHREVEQMLAEREALRARQNRHEAALAEIDDVEQRALEEAERLDVLRRELADLDRPRPRTASDVLALVEPIVDQAAGRPGGPVPLAMACELADLGGTEVDRLLTRLVELAQRAQIIVVSDEPAVAEWAAAAGLDRALYAQVRSVPVGATGRSTPG